MTQEIDYHKAYRVANKEKIAAYQKKWYQANKETAKAKKRIYDELCKKTKAANAKARHVADPRLVLVEKAKRRAKRLGLSFDMTRDDIIVPDFCPVLGIPLVVGDGMRWDNSPSLDRIAPELGYVRGNVMVISWRANRLKSDGNAKEHFLIHKYIENPK